MANNKEFKVKNGIEANTYQEDLGTIITSSTSYDLANASYDSINKFIRSQEASPLGLFFRSDGLKLYIVGAHGDEVNEYDLSTAWDITTASALQLKSISDDSNPSGIFFKSDGTKMYICGYTNDNVYEYNLSTAWDISTVGSVSHTLDVSSVDNIPIGLFFKPDGSKMYITGDQHDKIHEYNLSTDWDLSTASYSQSSPSIYQSSRQLFFTPDGLKVFLPDTPNDNITEYSLSTAWDVSTLSQVRQFNVSSQEANPSGLFFKSDGSKMYIVGTTNDRIYQYSTSVALKTLDLSTGSVFQLTPSANFKLVLDYPAASGIVCQATLLLGGHSNTINYNSNIQFSGGAAPLNPSTNETDVLVFSTRNGGTTYQASLAIDGAK